MAQAKPEAGGRNRPISPHLTIYRKLSNMVMSILHRITGAALYFGTIIMAAWLVSAAMGPDAFSFVNGILGTWAGKLVLLGYTWALMHHMLGGFRHLIWDTGRGFDLSTINFLSMATIVGSLALTALIWLVGLKGIF